MPPKWQCPECGAKARVPNVSGTIRCSCGSVVCNDIVVRKSVSRIESEQPADRRVPTFEHKQRLAACTACSTFKTRRCPLIDLGCSRTFEATIWSTRGQCPLGKWPDGRVEWITTADLAAGAMELADQVPPDVTRVVGIPRSGMIPAAAIASKLHLPLYTIRDWQVEPAGGGFRIGWGEGRDDSAGGRWLFVDDTLHNGSTFRTLRSQGIPTGEHVTAAIYALDPSQIDLYYRQLPTPHLLEWNLLNTGYVQHLAVDFDGVLCHNPPHQARPKFLARLAPIRAIISARPESEREQSEAWLNSHGVLYQSLRLWPGSEADRWDIERVAAWKAAECSAAGAEFYIESEPDLADAIRRLGLRVLCPQQGYLA